jgi:hypothetical protein
MSRTFILTVLIFITVMGLSYTNLRAETTNNYCTSVITSEQKTNKYQQQISNSYEIAQSINKYIPYAIIITLVIAIFLISHHFHGNKQDILRFIYGTDNLAAISLIAFGSLHMIFILFLVVGLSGSLNFFPPMMYYATSWKAWMFLIGLIGFLTRKQRSSSRRKNIGVIRSFFMSKGYQMPIWLILIGIIWIVEVATETLPSLLKFGEPGPIGYICIPPTLPDSLPLLEIVSFFITEPSFILIVVGICIILLKWIISVTHR